MPIPRAFPCMGQNEENDGMELRDYIAISVLNGIISSLPSTEILIYDKTAEETYKIADAMLKARKQKV